MIHSDSAASFSENIWRRYVAVLRDRTALDLLSCDVFQAFLHRTSKLGIIRLRHCDVTEAYSTYVGGYVRKSDVERAARSFRSFRLFARHDGVEINDVLRSLIWQLSDPRSHGVAEEYDAFSICWSQDRLPNKERSLRGRVFLDVVFSYQYARVG